jgi:hypothetical protein
MSERNNKSTKKKNMNEFPTFSSTNYGKIQPEKLGRVE